MATATATPTPTPPPFEEIVLTLSYHEALYVLSELGRSNDRVHGLTENPGVYDVLAKAIFPSGVQTAEYKNHCKVATALRGPTGYNFKAALKVARDLGVAQ